MEGREYRNSLFSEECNNQYSDSFEGLGTSFGQNNIVKTTI